jgi:uncharacterized protein YoxC
MNDLINRADTICHEIENTIAEVNKLTEKLQVHLREVTQVLDSIKRVSNAVTEVITVVEKESEQCCNKCVPS